MIQLHDENFARRVVDFPDPQLGDEVQRAGNEDRAGHELLTSGSKFLRLMSQKAVGEEVSSKAIEQV